MLFEKGKQKPASRIPIAFIGRINEFLLYPRIAFPRIAFMPPPSYKASMIRSLVKQDLVGDPCLTLPEEWRGGQAYVDFGEELMKPFWIRGTTITDDSFREYLGNELDLCVVRSEIIV